MERAKAGLLEGNIQRFSKKPYLCWKSFAQVLHHQIQLILMNPIIKKTMELHLIILEIKEREGLCPVRSVLKERQTTRKSRNHSSMADKDSTQTDADSRTQIAEMAVSVEKFIQRINVSPGISRETIEAMSEAVKKISQARILLAGEVTKIYHEEARESSQASMLRADEATKIYPELENTFAKLNDTISEMDRRMLESATKIMELKKGREEFMKLFNEMRDISRERNHSKVREKIDSVNHWLKKRIIDIDEIMKEEDSATGFDHAAALGKEEDVLCSRNGSDDTEGSRKRQRRGHEPYKFSVLLVQYDTSARIQNKTQIIQFIGRNNLGVKFQVAENGQQAVDLHSRDKASFNLILMDMDMPVHVTTGPEATRSLRALGVKSTIVGFSSESESEKIHQFISSGLSGCLKKPLTVEKIASFLPRPSSQQAKLTHRGKTKD